LKEIRFFQRNTDLLIKRLPFARLVKEVMNSSTVTRNKDCRWQEAAEAQLVGAL
jgi:histone H3/H4